MYSGENNKSWSKEKRRVTRLYCFRDENNVVYLKGGSLPLAPGASALRYPLRGGTPPATPPDLCPMMFPCLMEYIYTLKKECPKVMTAPAPEKVALPVSFGGERKNIL
jgi:hypothetical protein